MVVGAMIFGVGLVVGFFLRAPSTESLIEKGIVTPKAGPVFIPPQRPHTVGRKTPKALSEREAWAKEQAEAKTRF